MVLLFVILNLIIWCRFILRGHYITEDEMRRDVMEVVASNKDLLNIYNEHVLGKLENCDIDNGFKGGKMTFSDSRYNMVVFYFNRGLDKKYTVFRVIRNSSEKERNIEDLWTSDGYGIRRQNYRHP
jgi:hypothetical protein